MGDYLRSTRECSLDSLNPLLATVIREHIEKYALGDVEAAVLICCETTSTKQKKGLFRSKAEVMLTGMLLTPKWLIWGSIKGDKVLGVLSARLHDIQVQDYEESDMYKLMADSGIHIDGLRTSTGPGSAFIGLGAEPAAERFREALKAALEKA